MQRVYILSQTEYSNILGIFTNIRQTRKFILTLTDQENLLLHEMRLNEPLTRKDVSKLLIIDENSKDYINQQKQKMEKELKSQNPQLKKEVVKVPKVKLIKVQKIKVVKAQKEKKVKVQKEKKVKVQKEKVVKAQKENKEVEVAQDKVKINREPLHKFYTF